MALSSTGITVSAVKTALGSTNNNVGGLCSSSLINPWSKWKPISLNATTMTLALLKNANYGITIKNATTASALLTAVKNNNNLGFTYNKPTGISTSPYRLGDFRNYDHTANLPIGSYYEDGDDEPINGVSSTYSKTISGLESADSPDETDDSLTYLTKYNIYPSTDTNGNAYTLTRGLLVTDGTNTSWSVGSVPWGNSNWQRFKGKECTVLEFLTNLADGTTFATHTSASSDRFYALPYPLHTINVTNVTPSGSKTVFIDLSQSLNKIAFQDTTYGKVVYNFQFSSIGSVYAGGTIQNVYIGLYRDINCTDVITQKKLADSITIGSEEVGSNYFGTLTNTGNSPTVYVGFYWNYSKQYVTVPMAEVDRPELEQ